MQNQKMHVQQVLVPCTASTYSNGAAIGGLIQISGFFRRALSGLLKSVGVIDFANQKSALDVVFFKSKPANALTDNTVPTFTLADLELIQGVASLPAANYGSFTGQAVGFANNLDVPLEVTAEPLNLVVISRGTPTYAHTTDLQLTLGISQDE